MKTWLASAALGAVLLVQGCGARSPPAQSEVAPPAAPPHPYTVEGLRARVFSPSALTVEEDLGDRGTFRSAIVSYLSDGLRLSRRRPGPGPGTR